VGVFERAQEIKANRRNKHHILKEDVVIFINCDFVLQRSRRGDDDRAPQPTRFPRAGIRKQTLTLARMFGLLPADL
jgi:hypothetical protein